MNIQELNYQNAPVIEEATNLKRALEQLRRRVCCGRMGKAKLTSNDAEVDEDCRGPLRLVGRGSGCALVEFLVHPM
jgi:hypothetical protein